MKISKTAIPEVLIIEPQVFGDERGFFFESFNQRRWKEKTGLDTRFVQENHSSSSLNVLRGLHYQVKQSQGKLVRVILGEVFDVAVDIRKSSPTFGRWVGTLLSASNKQQMWIPEGFAHGFVALSERVEILYLATDYYAPEYERAIIWNDPQLAIDWPVEGEPLLSSKDRQAGSLQDAELFS